MRFIKHLAYFLMHGKLVTGFIIIGNFSIKQLILGCSGSLPTYHLFSVINVIQVCLCMLSYKNLPVNIYLSKPNSVSMLGHFILKLL